MSKKNATIRISIDTRDNLRPLGQKGDTYDQIIQDLIIFYLTRKEGEK